MNKSQLHLSLITLGGLASALLFAPVLLGDRGDASAEAAERTTVLWLSTEVMEPGEPALPTITAEITSERATDQRVQIDTFWHDAEDPTEVAGGSTWTDRTTSGVLGVQWQIPQAEFRSGMTFRAQFTAFGPGGTVSSTCSKTLVIP